MTIRISRNDSGNCINFIGTTNPAYWNACLSGEINADNPNNINIINDVRTLDLGQPTYEFFNLPYTDFEDKEGNAFASVEDAVAYINTNANVSGNTGTFNLTAQDTMSFSLDSTSTSIVFSNGDSYGVNTIKASNTGDGVITISQNTDDGRVLYTGLEHTNVSVDEVAVSGGVADVINVLNELFTVGPFQSVVIADPYATMVADVGGVADSGTSVGSNAIDPIGDAILASSSAHYNRAGWVSDESLDQPGEYFTFDIQGTDSMGFGFILDQGETKYGAGSYADPAMFCNDSTSSSANWGYYWSHWFHSGNKGPWTYYGQRTASSIKEGWGAFGSSEERVDYIAGSPIKIKVGIDVNGYMEVSWWDVSESTWRQIQRSSYVLEQGESVKLGIKIYGTSGKLYNTPKKHLLTPEAPTLYYRYIESPDGVFNYPLFATEEEANWYDKENGGTGTGSSHTHDYDDDPTNTTWYMPDNGSTMAATSAPTGSEYTVITSLTNADLTPGAFTFPNITQEENTAVNLQLYPAGATFSQSVTISPTTSGLVYNSATGYLQGTLADVGSDTTYEVTVTRANTYGSTSSTFDIVATNVAPVNTMLTPWTKALDFSGSNEHLSKVNTWNGSNPLLMDSTSSVLAAPSVVGNTASGSLARPWATAIVFKYDGNSSNQHIWNSGEGAGSTDDNIYLRLDASGYLYLGWGRQGALNECRFIYLGTTTNTNHWHGIYIAHNGTRLSGSNATAANLAACFDIRWFSTNYTGGVFGSWMDNKSTAANWTAGSTGARMDRAFTGSLTIGGRGSNRNFHGTVASMIVTTLRLGVAMPTDAEIDLMVTDPKKWEDDYRIGQTVRRSSGASDVSYTPSDVYNGYGNTQIWLMGDGTSDSYTNGIRNEVYPSDQNYGKLQLNSMVSNDIQTVNISGLT